jgi:hypothetical protein
MVEAMAIRQSSPDDGETFFVFRHPDRNTRAVQELKVRGVKPLIPVEHRGRFGTDGG